MMTRAARLLVVLAVVANTTTGVSASAAAGRLGPCTTSDDAAVTVVIDYQGLGGDTRVYCATGLADDASGRDALAAVGVAVAGTTHDGASFVCRLDGRPGPREIINKPADPAYIEDCVDTPPGDAYWSYWQAAPGGGWDYSATGLNSRVRLGGFEGWSFALGQTYGSGAQPRVEPVTPLGPSTPTATTPPPKVKTPKSKPSKSKRSKLRTVSPEPNSAKPKPTKAAHIKPVAPAAEAKPSPSTAKTTASTGVAANPSLNSFEQSLSPGITEVSNPPITYDPSMAQINPPSQNQMARTPPPLKTHGNLTRQTQPAAASGHAKAAAPGNSPVVPAIAAITVIGVAAIAGLIRIRRNRWGR